jgi:antibiotic biosynthesis monooxygenase (ABM) superfamily enzyme
MGTSQVDRGGSSNDGARTAGVGSPRWKLAVLAWVAAFPTVAVLSPLLSPGLDWLHPVLRTALIVAIMIGMMTFVWMPLLTRVFSRWLGRSRTE